MADFLGFQYMVILDLHRILFHAVVIFGPEHDFLFKSASTYCACTFILSYISYLGVLIIAEISRYVYFLLELFLAVRLLWTVS